MRARRIPSITGHAVLALSLAVGGCGKLKRNDPAQAARARAEVKRQQTACGSASAGDRLKNSIFDQAIARRRGDPSNLDVLADYSVARLQDPVVKGWDPSLDITRCKGRFILEVPPGAESGFTGQRQLEADIEYTAQASADGAGFVYQPKGAEPIVARLAAFNLRTAAYRPPPAIDETQGLPKLPQQAAVAEQQPAQMPSKPVKQPVNQPAPAPVPKALPSTPTKALPHPRVAEQTSTEPRAIPLNGSGPGDGEATVRAFYNALGGGNGAAASSHIVPEKRSTGAFSPGAMSRFYGRLPEPIRLTSIVPVAGGAYRVSYRYSAGRSHCNGSAVVRLTKRGGRSLISSIRSLSGC